MIADSFQGYQRADGSVGVRNLVAVIPSCGCAQHAAARIASLVDGAALLNYTGGCGETEGDIALATDLLAQYARHPNVIGTLVVSLGCETLNAHLLAEKAGNGTAPVELLTIQELGALPGRSRGVLNWLTRCDSGPKSSIAWHVLWPR